MSHLTDEELVQLYLDGQIANYFEELYVRYYTKVLRQCYFYTNDHDSAADLTQDIFIKLMGKLPSFMGRSKFSTWIHVVTLNHCTDQLRKLNSRPYMNSQVDWDKLEIETADNSGEQIDRFDWHLNWSMKQLTAEEVILLRMKYEENRSLQEIANDCDLSIPATKMRLKRSRDKLKRYYLESYNRV